VIVDYLDDLSVTNKRTLLPSQSNPYARALVRLQCDHINRTLVPAFYRYLQAQDSSAQIECGKEFLTSIEQLVTLFEGAEQELEGTAVGLWKEGGQLGRADIMAGPWLFRACNVLKHYRGFELPQGPKVGAWLGRLFDHPAFKVTCSIEELYLDSYERLVFNFCPFRLILSSARRYAYNRPNTSQVANAINSGRGLP